MQGAHNNDTVSEVGVTEIQPSLSERAVLQRQEELINKVHAAIAEAASRVLKPASSGQERFLALRDEVSEVNADDLPAIVTQMELVRQQTAALLGNPLPDPRVPFFAHMRLKNNRGARDILLGYETFIDSGRGVRIVDWRTAPVAKVFFETRVGEEYRLELPQGANEGILEERNVITFADGVAVRINTGERSFHRGPDGNWLVEGTRLPTRLTATQKDTHARQLTLGRGQLAKTVVTALLDEQQFAAMEADQGGALLLVGAAGCGKTTVALHRLAMLHARHPRRYPLQSIVIIVPTEGLVRLTKLLLKELKLPGVKVCTFDAWVRETARRAFKPLPTAECLEPPTSVVRFKRHPAIMVAIQAYAERVGREIADRLDQVLETKHEVRDLYEQTRGHSIANRLMKTEKRFGGGRSEEDKRIARAVFKREKKPLFNHKGDRLLLLGDSELLGLAAKASQGALKAGDVHAVVEHTRAQFSESFDERYGHIDADRLITLDGRRIDEGTPEELVGTIDVEDYAILLEIQRQKSGTPKTYQSLSHLIVDEAQDLTSVELSALGCALEPRASVTVAGDSAQHIDPSACFVSWKRVLQDLRTTRTETISLTTNYRCTRQVAQFAHAILGADAPSAPPLAPRTGLPVEFSTVPNLAHAAIEVIDTLNELVEREPYANIAVVTRDPENARTLNSILCRGLESRLVLDGDFEFDAGVDVTCVSQVRGLEFDYVILPDVSSGDYPPDAASRRAFHVAATRTIHQLWVIIVGREPSMVAEARAACLREQS
ncbi:MAG: hypothetical protein AUK47_26280 [Deltaproteobacteria bacterium CG2_30_63_29]|nr:MAG: hypothetical protein AUK47_26280 [Deltaproteobacteria bacterium CG2_30_63_29]PJB49183.1 MAG: hypothetical protein CO108_00685 [Deltaproteobacteria bacterium CG_4_9_14_3_um_filter_63_12]